MLFVFLSAKALMLLCFCALDVTLRLTKFTQSPIQPQTAAAISKGNITGTDNPIPAKTTPAEINTVSTPSVILIPLLYFLYKVFLTSLSFINSFSISEIFCNRKRLCLFDIYVLCGLSYRICFN